MAVSHFSGEHSVLYEFVCVEESLSAIHHTILVVCGEVRGGGLLDAHLLRGEKREREKREREVRKEHKQKYRKKNKREREHNKNQKDKQKDDNTKSLGNIGKKREFVCFSLCVSLCVSHCILTQHLSVSALTMAAVCRRSCSLWTIC